MRPNTFSHRDSVIRVEDVSKAFRVPSIRRETIREHVFGFWQPRSFERFQVLDHVSLQVRRGETLGIMGRNGCGKTTLLKIICGIYRADDGVVRSHAAMTPILELGVGWNPELNAIDNIYLIGSVMGLSLSDIRRNLHEILSFAELERFAELELKHYSSGMSARLAYAVAFHAVREVLIIDEIFAVGDAGFRERCQRRYRELRSGGHTVILVSHDPHIVSTFCDRAVLLDAGKVITEGRPADVSSHYARLVGQQPSDDEASTQAVSSA